jgi:hypothetical protein
MAEERKRRWLWRPLLRATHRDVGYLIVGLTLIYAASGLAVNHIGQWDPNFDNYDRVHELGPLAGADAEIAARVVRALDIGETPREVYRAAEDQLDVLFAHRTLHVDPRTGHVIDEGQRPRFFLRLANWLHLNRGKKAWTYAADAYAILLGFLAVSGLFMIKGPKGLWRRGLVFLLVGMAVPVAYVAFSGGP